MLSLTAHPTTLPTHPGTLVHCLGNAQVNLVFPTFCFARDMLDGFANEAFCYLAMHRGGPAPAPRCDPENVPKVFLTDVQNTDCESVENQV